MNIDTLAGQGTELKGQVKETLGAATADPTLQQEGIADQILGRARQAFGGARDFARNQPIAAAAIATAIGFALFRGRRASRRG